MPERVRKWKDALARPDAVEELELDARQLPRVKWPRSKMLPAEIGKLVHLRKLRIRATQLGALCPELGSLAELEELSIENTDFVLEIGDELSRLPGLRSLELYSVGVTGYVAMPESLEHLSLACNERLDVEAWIAGLAALPRLRSLSLAQACPPGRLPASIAELRALRALNLAQNGYAELPDVVMSLTALESLDLAVNQLTALPDELGGLRAVKVLRLQANALATLPDALAHLDQLEELQLGGNPLAEIPAWIGELRRLRILDLSQIRLSDLPPGLTQLPLEKLWVDVPDEVLAELRRRLPRCTIVSRSRDDAAREIDGWLRFFGR